MPLPHTAKKWFAASGIGLAVFIAAMALHASGLLTIAELKSLDHRFKQYADPAKADKSLVLVAVDETSLDAFGRWPWPRDRFGYVVHYLHTAGARAIVVDILFLEPDANDQEFDVVFAEEVRAAGNVFFPFLLQHHPSPALSARLLSKATIPLDSQPERLANAANSYQGLKLPIPPLAEAARGLGHITLTPDQDGTMRRLPPLVPTAQGAVSQLATAVARDILRAEQAGQDGRTLRLGPTTVPATPDGDIVLHGHAIALAPPWAFVLTTLVLCIGTAWAFVLVQRQALKFLLIAGLAVAYYGLVVHAFSGHGVWMELVFPEGALALTYAVSATVEYLTEGRQRRVLRAVFDKYMAAEVVDEIMRNPASIKLGGEKKELTVFFSDVAGFTTISEKLDPEDLVFLLNEYLSSMTDIILRNRGNVNKYLGDGIMALFGAPRGEPDHASRACVAALENQAALAKLRKEWAARGYPEIVARIGINSGPLVVGNMGSQARMEYTVMGDSVNLASRLEGANKFYDTLILLGPRTYELAQPDIEAREVDMLRVKGKLEPVVVYELLARKWALPAEKQRVVALYQDGLAVYKRREFVRAKERFEAALALDPSDGPSKVYLHRVLEYLATPPPTDWDGVYVLQSK